MNHPAFKNRANLSHDINGKTVWESRSVVVIATVVSLASAHPDILLVKRARGTYKEGMWCLPCGFLDYDETALEAAQREVWEESGIDTTEPGWVFETDPWRINSIPSNEKQHVSIYYNFTKAGPRPNAKMAPSPQEIEETAWIPISQAQEMDLAFNHSAAVSALAKSHFW